jgi:hypothetical protein
VIAAAWTEPVNATPTWQTVTSVYAVFSNVRLDKLEHFPFVGGVRPEGSGGLDNVIADPGDGEAIPVHSTGYCPLVSAAAETRTVAVPTFAGQLLLLEQKTDAGAITVTFSQAFNEDSDTTAVFDDAGDYGLFIGLYVGANLRWRMIAQGGLTGMVGKDSDLDTIIADPGDAGAIPVTGSGQVPLVTAGAETRTLAVPSYAGQRLLLYLKTDGGDCVVTVAQAINAEGRTTLTLDDAGDHVLLVGIEEGANLRWRVASAEGIEALDIDVKDLAETGNLAVGVPVIIRATCTAGGAEDENVLVSADRKLLILESWMISRDTNAANVTLKNATNAFTSATAKGTTDDAKVEFDGPIAEYDEVAAGAAIIATFSAAGSVDVCILAVPIA